MARAMLDYVVRDRFGTIESGVTVAVSDIGTEPMYNRAVGGVVVSNPLESKTDGRLDAYTDAARSCTLLIGGSFPREVRTAFRHDPAALEHRIAGLEQGLSGTDAGAFEQRVSTLEQALSGTVANPMQHGATGDGVADDDAAVQAALAALVAAGGGTLLLSRKHKITTPIVVAREAPISVVGVGTTSGQNLDWGDDPVARTKVGFVWAGGAGAMLTFRSVNGIRCENVVLDGAGLADVCLKVDTVKWSTFRHLQMIRTRTAGTPRCLWIGASSAGDNDNTQFCDFSNIYVRDVISGASGNAVPFYLSGFAGDGFNDTAFCHFQNLAIDFSGARGMYVGVADNCTFINTWILRRTGSGVGLYVSGAAENPVPAAAVARGNPTTFGSGSLRFYHLAPSGGAVLRDQSGGTILDYERSNGEPSATFSPTADGSNAQWSIVETAWTSDGLVQNTSQVRSRTRFRPTWSPAGAVTAPDMVAVSAEPHIASPGVVTEAVGFLAKGPTGAGAATSLYGVRIANQTKGTTTNIGLLIDPQTAPGAFAIYADGGPSFFRDTLYTGDLHANATGSLYRTHYQAVAAGASLSFGAMAGKLLLIDDTGWVCELLLHGGNGAATAVSNPAPTVFTVGSDAGSFWAVSWTGAAYAVKNRRATPANIRVHRLS